MVDRFAQLLFVELLVETVSHLRRTVTQQRHLHVGPLLENLQHITGKALAQALRVPLRHAAVPKCLERLTVLVVQGDGAAKTTPEGRKRVRLAQAQPILDEFFAWCDKEALVVIDETPISKAIGYLRNQRVPLQRFLEDGRLPMKNNLSERELRREAVGRRNWLFIGNDDAGEVNATFVTLLATCQLHGLEPLGYLRDLLCLLPSWPVKRVLELAPAYWKKTLEQENTQQRLAANVFRQVSLGEHSPKK